MAILSPAEVRKVYYFCPGPPDQLASELAKRFTALPVERQQLLAPSWDLPAVILADARTDALEWIERIGPDEDAWRLIYLFEPSTAARPALSDRVFLDLPYGTPGFVLEKAIDRAFESLLSLEERRQTRRELGRATRDFETLGEIGSKLSSQRDPDELLGLILAKAREISGCDAATVYLVEQIAAGARRLIFTKAQNFTLGVEPAGLAASRAATSGSNGEGAASSAPRLPIDGDSAAGHVAATGEILEIRDLYRIHNRPFPLDRERDAGLGYRTKSLLVVPMKNQKNEIIGVLELANAKKHPTARLDSPAAVEDEVIPFSAAGRRLAASLASQAAVALENSTLYRDIQRQFESFVEASVTTIEMRDPTTFGHSERVAKLTIGLAEQVDRSEAGCFEAIHFSRQDLLELRYASRLHDFGKIGVVENVLVKAKKLYPQMPSLEFLRERFGRARGARRNASLEKKLRRLRPHLTAADREEFARIDAELELDLGKLDEFLEVLTAANEPSVLAGEVSRRLEEIAAARFTEFGAPLKLLPDDAYLRLLSIPRGTLDDEERDQIRSHVVESHRFLREIRWTRELRRIPEIARAHHEKLDGSGYPDHKTAEEIPFPAKMMTIADIFDALTASDRPYKRAVSTERALDIIGGEVAGGLLDPDLFRLFVDAQVYQLTARDGSP